MSHQLRDLDRRLEMFLRAWEDDHGESKRADVDTQCVRQARNQLRMLEKAARALVAAVERDDNPRTEGHFSDSDEMRAMRAALGQSTPVIDHPFEPSQDGSDRCAHIVEGATWTMADPHRCRRQRSEHQP